MSLSRAWQQFCQELFEPHCEHVNVHSHGEHCPDCGDRVQLLWAQVRCRDCGARRKPKPRANGSHGNASGAPVRALTPYCRFCGSHQVRVVKKLHIERYELPYSVLSRETDYAEKNTPAQSVFRSKRPEHRAPEAQAYTPSPKSHSRQGERRAQRPNPFSSVSVFESELRNQTQTQKQEPADLGFKGQSDEALMFGLRQFMNEERASGQASSTFRSVMDVDLTHKPNPFKPIVDGDVLSSEYLS